MCKELLLEWFVVSLIHIANFLYEYVKMVGMDTNMVIIFCNNCHHYFTWTVLLDGRQHIDHCYSSVPWVGIHSF
jgi:hypothetical protein